MNFSQELLRKVSNKLTSNKIRLLDFGCGVGLSTEMTIRHLSMHSEYTVEALGVDINESNLEIARKKLPQMQFKCISINDKLDNIGQFDLIICNFVLVEMKSNDILNLLNLIKSNLYTNGILIITNPTARAYRPENHWYTFNNQFSENIPNRKSEAHEKLKYFEDQPIKVQVFASKNSSKSFAFFDYFHSGSAYRDIYETAGLKLLETYKPVGKDDDEIEWGAEFNTPPYKIHILGN